MRVGLEKIPLSFSPFHSFIKKIEVELRRNARKGFVGKISRCLARSIYHTIKQTRQKKFQGTRFYFCGWISPEVYWHCNWYNYWFFHVFLFPSDVQCCLLPLFWDSLSQKQDLYTNPIIFKHRFLIIMSNAQPKNVTSKVMWFKAIDISLSFDPICWVVGLSSLIRSKPFMGFVNSITWTF